MRTPIVTLLLCACALGAAGKAGAQEPGRKSGPIQDNSFLLEEAYNQEKGVVQHISTFMLMRDRSWGYTFTQEWPVGGQRHQLSYTVPFSRVAGANRFQTGFGDLAINYRYQLAGSGETRVAVSPRLTLLLPTGNASRGLGSGGTGVQVNLPASVVLTPWLVSHTNAGATYTPRATVGGTRDAIRSVNAGQSLIWLASPRVNFMLEAAWTRTQLPIAVGLREWESAFLLSPGLRGAIDFPSGLQVVPGIAVPIGVGPSSGERGILLYLSFEHPFAATR